MLYDFIRRKEYAIDINALLSILEQNKNMLIKNGVLLNANELFSAWQRLLTNLYETEIHENGNDTDQEIEYFQKQINYGSLSILLHFNVNFLKTNAHTAHNQIIPLDTIVDFADYELITKSNLKIKHSSSNPVFVVPFPKNKKSCLLVDGNHRLSYAIYNGKEDIAVSNFSLNVAATSLMSPFEQAFYCYEIEVWEYGSTNSNYYPIEKSKINWFLRL